VPDSRVVVVTGASSGIGAELARQLARRGDRVVLAARREAELEALRRELGPNARAVPTDVTRRSEVEQLRDRTISEFGGVDVWVNNAGRGITRNVLDLSDADVDEMIAVNVKSALYGMQAIVPYFVARERGHLINVSSFLSRVPMATVRSAYNAAKAALNALTANLRMDLAPSHPGVHVTLIMPGVVTTDFHKNALGGTSGPPPTRPGLPAGQSAGEVAAAIIGVIDRPVAELYTNPQHPAVAERYFRDVDAFERGLQATPR
jgi:short-subunit dehydrogenase